MEIAQIKKELAEFVPKKKHDKYAIETIKEAIAAAESGTFGVGAVLVDKKSDIIFRGRNKVFTGGRSDMHAEMDVMNKFEEAYPRGQKRNEMLQDLTLFTSLESCPMCFCRLVSGKVKKVYHVADDNFGGMVNLKHQLPGGWQSLFADHIFERADCSRKLSELGLKIFLATIKLNDNL